MFIKGTYPAVAPVSGPKCEYCGRRLARNHPHYSWSAHNRHRGVGITLHGTCARKLEEMSEEEALQCLTFLQFEKASEAR